MNPGQLNLLHILLLFLSAFTILYFSFQSYRRDKTSPPEFQQISNNWKQGAILDLTVAPSTCPDGYQEAFSYTWPGNPKRCYCADATFFTRVSYNIDSDTYLEPCTANQIKAGCRNIESQPPIDVNSVAKSDGQGMVICLKRSNETWASAGPSSDNPCLEAGTTPCGRSRENIFCTREKKCPITNIQIVQNTLEVANCKYENGCVVLSKENGQLVKFERSGSFDGLPVSEFKLTEYRICQDPTKDNVSPGRKEYWALNVQRTQCEKEGTAFWPPIGFTMTEKDLWDINGVTPKVEYFNNFDGYYEKGKWKSGTNFNWHLYSRSYIPWSLSCRSQMGIISESDENFERVTRAQKIQFYIVILGTISFGIIVPYLLFTDMNSKRAKAINILVKLFQGLVQIYAFRLAEFIVNNLNSFNDQKCTNEPFLGSLQEGSGEIHSVYHYDMAGIVVLAAILLFDIGREVYLMFFFKEEAYHSQVNIQLKA